jgi:hypothetical protein
MAVTSCTRCGGFIIAEQFRDIGISTVGWHCLLCGETVDDVILRNRERPFLRGSVDEETIQLLSPDDQYEFGASEGDCEEWVFDQTLS